jgi:hypothetical protein
MNKVIVTLLMASLAINNYAQLLPNEDKASFADSLKSTCYSAQRDALINSSLSNSDIKSYCDCIALKVSNEMTLQALNQFVYDIKTLGKEDAIRFFNESVHLEKKSKQCISEWINTIQK